MNLWAAYALIGALLVSLAVVVGSLGLGALGALVLIAAADELFADTFGKKGDE